MYFFYFFLFFFIFINFNPFYIKYDLFLLNMFFSVDNILKKKKAEIWLSMKNVVNQKKINFWFLEYNFFIRFKYLPNEFLFYQKPKIHKNWELNDSLYRTSIISKLSLSDKFIIFSKSWKHKLLINPLLQEFFITKRCMFPYLSVETKPYINVRKKKRGLIKRTYVDKVNFPSRHMVTGFLLVQKTISKKGRNYPSKNQYFLETFFNLLKNKKVPDIKFFENGLYLIIKLFFLYFKLLPYIIITYTQIINWEFLRFLWDILNLHSQVIDYEFIKLLQIPPLMPEIIRIVLEGYPAKGLLPLLIIFSKKFKSKLTDKYIKNLPKKKKKKKKKKYILPPYKQRVDTLCFIGYWISWGIIWVINSYIIASYFPDVKDEDEWYENRYEKPFREQELKKKKELKKKSYKVFVKGGYFLENKEKKVQILYENSKKNMASKLFEWSSDN